MKTYKINEIFYSIQAEGYWAGTPAVFVRFAGCNLNCDWCDTDHSCKMELTAREIELAIQEVGQYDNEHRNPIVVLTGGEPLLQVDGPLLDELHLFTLHIETNGCFPLPSGKNTWLTVSPKAEGLLILARRSIDEIKVVLDGRNDPEQWTHLSCNRFIQPCHPRIEGNRLWETELSENIDKAVRYVKDHPWWRLSLQWHKMIGIQ